jgi:type II secretory pathway pseudopilin PulG
MTRITRTTRRAFTLVELLVAMGVLITLASIALMVIPDVMSQDRTTDAAGSVRQWLSTAKARAARDQQPRGVRFLVAPMNPFTVDPNNPAKTSPYWVTELQYTEAIPVLPLTTSINQFSYVLLTFSCAYDSNGNSIYGPIPGNTSVSSPQCQITRLALSDANLITVGSLITLSTLNASYRVLSTGSGPTLGPVINGNQSFTLTVTLDSFPQAQLGAAGIASQVGQTPPLIQVFQTPLFGITAPPQPLVGEPTLPLPRNVCIDLTASQTGSTSLGNVTGDVDIVFLPSGQVMPTWTFTASGTPLAIGATSQIFLWVRDYTKILPTTTNPQSNPLNYLNSPPAPVAGYEMAPFTTGGEQQVVSLKSKSGAMGVFPVMWPTNNYGLTGGYAGGYDSFSFARLGATSP